MNEYKVTTQIERLRIVKLDEKSVFVLQDVKGDVYQCECFGFGFGRSSGFLGKQGVTIALLQPKDFVTMWVVKQGEQEGFREPVLGICDIQRVQNPSQEMQLTKKQRNICDAWVNHHPNIAALCKRKTPEEMLIPILEETEASLLATGNNGYALVREGVAVIMFEGETYYTLDPSSMYRPWPGNVPCGVKRMDGRYEILTATVIEDHFPGVEAKAIMQEVENLLQDADAHKDSSSRTQILKGEHVFLVVYYSCDSTRPFDGGWNAVDVFLRTDV